MSGFHTITATYPDGSTQRIECICELCQFWRQTVEPKLDAYMRQVMPEVRPDWLGGDKP